MRNIMVTRKNRYTLNADGDYEKSTSYWISSFLLVEMDKDVAKRDDVTVRSYNRCIIRW